MIIIHGLKDESLRFSTALECGGSLEAVELQVIMLVEVKTLPLVIEQPRIIIKTYAVYLQQKFKDQPPFPLWKLCRGDEKIFVQTLRDFVTQADKLTGSPHSGK